MRRKAISALPGTVGKNVSEMRTEVVPDSSARGSEADAGPSVVPPHARGRVSVSSEPPRQLDVELLEVDVVDALEELGGPRGARPGPRGA